MSPTSLELRWLARSDKYILLPQLVFADIDYGGRFYYPRREELLINDKYYPMGRGVIIISDAYPEEIESSIAHEWRHLWQFYQGWSYWYAEWDLKSKESYRNKIIRFFKSDPLEMDALLFQLKKAPNDTGREWHEWIIRSRAR